MPPHSQPPGVGTDESPHQTRPFPLPRGRSTAYHSRSPRRMGETALRQQKFHRKPRNFVPFPL